MGASTVDLPATTATPPLTLPAPLQLPAGLSAALSSLPFLPSPNYFYFITSREATLQRIETIRFNKKMNQPK
jgi:hypothetical protein